jgi:hypothetical protein
VAADFTAVEAEASTAAAVDLAVVVAAMAVAGTGKRFLPTKTKWLRAFMPAAIFLFPFPCLRSVS